MTAVMSIDVETMTLNPNNLVFVKRRNPTADGKIHTNTLLTITIPWLEAQLLQSGGTNGGMTPKKLKSRNTNSLERALCYVALEKITVQSGEGRVRTLLVDIGDARSGGGDGGDRQQRGSERRSGRRRTSDWVDWVKIDFTKMLQINMFVEVSFFFFFFFGGGGGSFSFAGVNNIC